MNDNSQNNETTMIMIHVVLVSVVVTVVIHISTARVDP